MNKSSFKVIKLKARKKIKGHFGEVFLALLVVPFLFSLMNSAIGGSLSNFVILSYLFEFFFTVLISYVTLIMALKIARGDYDNLFKKMFGTKEGFINLAFYTAIMTVLTLLPFTIYYNFFIELTNYFMRIPPYYNPTFMEFINDITPFLPSKELMITSLFLEIIVLFVSVRLFFAQYLIIDKDMNVVVAIKKSWEYTKGNFLRICLFPLSFFGWFLLFFVTCGLIVIYLIPYMIVAYVVFYYAILRENGEDVIEEVEIFSSVEENKDDDPLAEDKDPFDDLLK